jgi:hypothetical protein
LQDRISCRQERRVHFEKRKPLIDRISKSTLPTSLPPKPITPTLAPPSLLIERQPLDFKKKVDNKQVRLQTRVDATITRVQVIFKNNDLFDTLTPSQRQDIWLIANQLNYIADHIEEISNWSEGEYLQVNFGLKHFADISFRDFKKNFGKICARIILLIEHRYWASIPCKEEI